MQTRGNRVFFTSHWPLITAVLLAGGWLLAAGCGGGGGGGVSDQQKQEVKGLVTGTTQGTEAAAGLETFSSGISNLYVYIPSSPYRGQARVRQTTSGTFVDETTGDVWSYTANEDGSGSATTTYLNGEDTGTLQASVEWSAVTIDPATGDELWSYSYSAADGSSATMNFAFGQDGSVSLGATATYIDPDTEVTYTMSFTMSITATGAFTMTMDVTGSDNTHLVGEFSMSPDGTWTRVSATFTDAGGYSITTTETITINPGPPETFTIEFTFHDNEGYSGDLTLNTDGSGQGHIRDPNGDEIATIDIAAGGSPITITYRDGTSEIIGGSMGRALKLLKR